MAKRGMAQEMVTEHLMRCSKCKVGVSDPTRERCGKCERPRTVAPVETFTRTAPRPAPCSTCGDHPATWLNPAPCPCEIAEAAARNALIDAEDEAIAAEEEAA